MTIENWTGKDWAGVYGAVLSTIVALREVAKHRSATRPRLTAFVRQIPARQVIETVNPLGHSEKGESHRIIVHNRGGVDTVVLRYHLFVAPRWVPGFLLGPMGALGWLPEDTGPYTGPAFQLKQTSVTVAAGRDADDEVREILWPLHRMALERGRLMLAVLHSWSREKPQQIRVLPTP